VSVVEEHARDAIERADACEVPLHELAAAILRESIQRGLENASKALKKAAEQTQEEN
jgi:hypothetical protein